MEDRVQKHQLAPLTGLRGIAAYSVLLAHASDTFLPNLHQYAPRLAYFGMSLFFSLSGFVIYYNYAELFRSERLGIATWTFFTARFARIYPLYAVSIVLAVITNPVPYFIDNPPVIFSFVTLTQSWFNMEMATFAPDWSISTEWFFYLTFLPLSFALARVRRPLLALVIWCLVSVVGLAELLHLCRGALIAFVEHFLWQQPNVSAGSWGWIIYFAPGVRWFEFAAGALAAKVYLSSSARPTMPITSRIGLGVAIAWCLAVIVVGKITSGHLLGNIVTNFLFAPALVTIILVCCVYDLPVSRALSSRPLLFAGETSYSVYIWSFSALTLLAATATPGADSFAAYANSALRVVASVFLTTVLGSGSYLLVEMPSRRAIRRWLSRSSERARQVQPVGRPLLLPSGSGKSR